MKTPILLASALLAAASVLPARAADEATLSFGGDEFRAGQHATISTPVAADAFIAGYDATLTAPVTGNAHLAGFNVSAGADIAGDLYAAGFSVNVSGTVGGAVTAFGNNVTVRSPGPVGGNARLSGESVTIGSPLGASALVAARSLNLDAPITGDFDFYGESITFGPAARVDGTLYIHAPAEIAVPATVAAADRVHWEQLQTPDYMQEAGRTATSVVNGFWPVFWAMATWWLVLLVIGAAAIALMPRRLAAMTTVSQRRPFRNFGVGILAFASVLGLVPLFAITLVGILLLPFVVVFVLIAASLAYLAGAYFIGLRIAGAFLAVDSNAKRLGVLAVSLVVALLLGMIPVIGWLLGLVIATFGFGVFAIVTMVRWSAGDAARLAAQPPPAAPAAGAA
jgi:hypothetical protein